MTVRGTPGALHDPAAAPLRLPRLLPSASGTIPARSLLLPLAVVVALLRMPHPGDIIRSTSNLRGHMGKHDYDALRNPRSRR
ncbi:hypothetical protein NDU88_001294 [Pleurodeles waltl]|uniref:Uncharacterized protein n=1 Tax=Pleurodeles waltl TaxID=8319 RepID=A0AAV7U6G5_PLEWA|nr:hypothetical protein NDU88_001294 [Pleurodeles waltl]